MSAVNSSWPTKLTCEPAPAVALQRVGLAANEAGEAEQGAGQRLHGEERFAVLAKSCSA